MSGARIVEIAEGLGFGVDDLGHLTSCDLTVAGCTDADCTYCYPGVSLVKLSNLALCLRDAGALCAAWVMGRDYGESPHLMRDDEWAPNADGDSAPDFEAPCGRNAGGGKQ